MSTPQPFRSHSAQSWRTDLTHRSITPTTPPVADAQDMLRLMRKSRGRVQGNVSFRDIHSHSGDWLSSYCYVDPDSASLLFEVQDSASDEAFDTLVPDLRGSRTRAVYDETQRISFLELLYRDPTDQESLLHLRPDRPTYFNTWYAALLCWQVCQPGQRLFNDHHDFNSLLRPYISDERPRALLRSERTNAPLRAERALFLVEGSPEFSNADYPSNTTATEVNCIVRGTGELSIHNLKSRTTLATIQLRSLPRSAIQRLHKSVFGLARSLAIYPQYALTQDACSSIRPVFLSFNFTDAFEIMLVLLKAFALPEVHLFPSLNPASEVKMTTSSRKQEASGNQGGLFRLEHFVRTRINRARLRESTSVDAARNTSFEFYVEILVDEQVKAKSSIRASSNSELYWADQFELVDMPSMVSSLSFRIKKRTSPSSETDQMSDTVSIVTSKTGMYVQSMHSAFDTVHGVAEVDLDKLPPSQNKEIMLELREPEGGMIGALSVTLCREEQLILCETEYDTLSSLLQTFANNVTLDIYARTPLHSSDLANVLLNVLQTRGTAEAWLRYLVRDEIFNTRRHIRQGSKAVEFADEEPALLTLDEDREPPDRTNEALLLFRGNTLLTKALDSYMRRLGQAYLETTLRVKLQDIADAEEDCEVDPSRLDEESDHKSNWQRLIKSTKDVWSFIRYSTFNCPLELRRIFRTIKDCAADRFGDVMPSKVFTSVSSFLFLRFFCAAILSPRLFGLLKAEPGPNAQRTFMLIAKSLQGLANMSTFGNKEHWMAPMNAFCATSRMQFESFVNEICEVSLDEQLPTGTPSNTSDERGVRVSASAQDPMGADLPSGHLDRSDINPLQAVPGASESDVGIQSRKHAQSGSLSSRISPPIATEERMQELRPTSPSDFNTGDSIAYSSSFSTDAEDPEERPDLSEMSDEFVLAAEGVAPVSREIAQGVSPTTRDTDSRMSMASQNTVIWLGSESSGTVSPLQKESFRQSSRASVGSLGSLDVISDELTALGRLSSKALDSETAVNSADVDSDDAHSDASDTTEAMMPPSIPLSRERTSGSTDSTEASRLSSTHTAETPPSTARTVPSLKGRRSPDISLNDPLHVVFERLPSNAREGLLTLPGLIDSSKNLALLAKLWLESMEIRVHRAAAVAAASDVKARSNVNAIIGELRDVDSPLGQFHRLCIELRDKADGCRASALDKQIKGKVESEEEEGGISANTISVKWVAVAERMEAAPHEFWTVRNARRGSRDSRESSVYTATAGSEGYSRSSISSRASRESIDTIRSISTMASGAPPPPAISRDARFERGNQSRDRGQVSIGGPIKSYPDNPTRSSGRGSRNMWGRFTGSGTPSTIPTSGTTGSAKKWNSRESVNSSGSSERTGSVASAKSKAPKDRKKSPQRTAEQNALRKLNMM